MNSPFFIYILYSSGHDRFYVGQTSDLPKRLIRHNKGYVKSTKAILPWIMVWHKEVASRSDSMAVEKLIKGWGSKNRIKQLVDKVIRIENW